MAISLAFPPLESRSFFGAYLRSQPANIRGQYGRGHRPLNPLWAVFTDQRQASVVQAGLNPQVPLSSRLIGRIILALAFGFRASSFFRHRQFFIQLPLDYKILGQMNKSSRFPDPMLLCDPPTQWQRPCRFLSRSSRTPIRIDLHPPSRQRERSTHTEFLVSL